MHSWVQWMNKNTGSDKIFILKSLHTLTEIFTILRLTSSSQWLTNRSLTKKNQLRFFLISLSFQTKYKLFLDKQKSEPDEIITGLSLRKHCLRHSFNRLVTSLLKTSRIAINEETKLTTAFSNFRQTNL